VTVTIAERDLLLNAAPLYLRCWILLCADLALRSGTAARVAPEHFDPEKETITIVTKASRTVTLPVSEELLEIFKAIGNRDPLTPYVRQLHRSGRAGLCKLDTNYLRNRWWRLRVSVGIKRGIRPHDLRRTAAVKALELTHDLRVVQALLGHTQLRSTLHYLDHRNQTISPELIGLLSSRRK
jgi:integrase